MQLRCLIVGVEESTAKVLRTALNALGVRSDYVTFGMAADRMRKARYESVVVHYDATPSAAKFVQDMRAGASNRDAVIFLLSTSGAEATSFRVPANFYLHNPVTAESVLRTFRSAYGLMVRQGARWHREKAMGTVNLSTGTVKNVTGTMVNLSMSGLCLKSTTAFAKGQSVVMRFALPGTESLVCLSGVVIWARDDGTIGVRFADIPAPILQSLQHWVEERLQLAKVYAAFKVALNAPLQTAI